MNEDFYLECLETVINEYLEQNPNADEIEAYNYACAHVDNYANDLMADMSDYYHDLAKDA